MRVVSTSSTPSTAKRCPCLAAAPLKRADSQRAARIRSSTQKAKITVDASAKPVARAR
jgi:hypothetical protein